MEMIAEQDQRKLFYQAKKRFWGRGHVLLGYDVSDKKLIEMESSNPALMQ